MERQMWICWVERMQVIQKVQCSIHAYRLSYCLSIITHSIRSLNTNTSINSPMEQQLKNVDLKGNTPSIWPTSNPQNMKRVHQKVQGEPVRTSLGKVDLKGIHSSICSLTPTVIFLFFTTLERRHADPLWVDVELNRNVRSVCLASRSTVRVSGGLKSSWGRVVGRHSSVTFLSCYSHQTAFNNQSLFAEIRIGLDWNAAEHSAPDKISQNTGCMREAVFLMFFWYVEQKSDNIIHCVDKGMWTAMFIYFSVLLSGSVFLCLVYWSISSNQGKEYFISVVAKPGRKINQRVNNIRTLQSYSHFSDFPLFCLWFTG